MGANNANKRDKLNRRYAQHRHTETIRRHRMKAALTTMRTFLELGDDVEQAAVMEAAAEALSEARAKAAQAAAQATASAATSSMPQSGSSMMADAASPVSSDAMSSRGSNYDSTETPLTAASGIGSATNPATSWESVLGPMNTGGHPMLPVTNGLSIADFDLPELNLSTFDFGGGDMQAVLHSPFLPRDSALFVTDVDSLKILDCNEATVSLFRAPSRATIVNQSAFELKLHTAEQQRRVQAYVHDALARRNVQLLQSIEELNTLDGNTVWTKLTFIVVCRSHSSTSGRNVMVVVAQPIPPPAERKPRVVVMA